MQTTLSPDRLHGLDAVRGFALLLGVALHASMAWLPGAEYFWIAADGDRSQWLGAGFYWIHGFRMTLFFLLAGYFARLGVVRLGVGGFVRDRGRRIVLPLLSLWFPVLMAIIAVLVWNAWLKNGGVMPAQEPEPPLSVHNFPLTHLWFLYVLTLFYAGALLLRATFAALDRGGHGQRVLDTGMRLLFPFAPLLVALPIAAALLSLPTWWAWFGVPTPDTGLIPNRAAVVAYGLAFAVGWALQRQPQLLAALARRWPLYLAAALVATGASLAILGVVPPSTSVDGDRADIAVALLQSLSAWAWSLGLLGVALRFLDRASPTRRWIADSSYWIYLVHVPLVMALQVAATCVQAPWWVEFPVVLVVALGLLFASYRSLVRHTWIGAALNGRRHPRANRAATAVATPIPGVA